MQTVIETEDYLDQANKLGLSPAERSHIKNYLATIPDAGDLMKETGGARKVRIARRGRGKSGGYRVITYYAAEDVPVFLLDVYSKGDKDNLSRAECNEIKAYLNGMADDHRANVRKRVTLMNRQKKEKGK